MPEKRIGLTQVSVQIPDALLAAAHNKRGERSLNAYLCELISSDTGTPFNHRGRGRPKAETTEPLKKPASKSRKKK